MRITEIKKVNVVSCIPDNPLYLRWQNTDNGFDHWLFGVTQTHSIDTKDGDTLTAVINYLEEANAAQQVIVKNGYLLITLGYEGLSENDVKGIQGIFGSPKVYIIAGQPGSDDFTRLQVQVQAGSFKTYETGESKHSLEFQIIAPKLNHISN